MDFVLNDIDRRLIGLFGHDVYAIGGRVRDFLINTTFGTALPCKDFDYVVTAHTLDEVRSAFESIGARIDAVGASFAVLKVTFDGVTIDVALPRRESSTGQGHRDFAVDFGPEVSLEDDQMRRDFTMNAASVQLATGQVIAAAGALDDIQNRTIRVLSATSFADDPVRMLRAAQFASRFGFAIDPATEAQIRAQAHLLATVAPERVNEELCKLLLKSPVPSVGIRLLVDLGLMPFVIPEILESVGVAQNVHHRFDVFGHLCAALDASAEDGGDLLDRLTALLHDIGKPRTAASRPDGQGNTFYGHEDVGAEMVVPILRRLRFAEEIVQTVASLVRNHMFATCESSGAPFSDSAVRRLIRRIGADLVERQFALREADMRGSGTVRDRQRLLVEALRARIARILEETPALSVSALAINGRDVIAYLVQSGCVPETYRGDRRVGQILSALLERVLDDPSVNTQERLLAEMRRLAA